MEGAFHLFRARLDFAPWPDPSEAKPLLGHLPRVEHALKAKGWSLEAYRAWAEEEGLLEDEEPHPEKVLTFAELAALSEGAPYLGALMLDADRMGEAFATGFRREGRDLATPSRLAALSRTLEVFFTTEVLTLLEEPRRYRERLGWDDPRPSARRPATPSSTASTPGGRPLPPRALGRPFGLRPGPGEALPPLHPPPAAHPLRGFLLVPPSLPVPELARLLGEAEKRAKAEGRERLFLFGQAVPWETLRGLRAWAEGLRQDLRAERVSRAQVYRWLLLWRRFSPWRTPGSGCATSPSWPTP